MCSPYTVSPTGAPSIPTESPTIPCNNVWDYDSLGIHSLMINEIDECSGMNADYLGCYQDLCTIQDIHECGSKVEYISKRGSYDKPLYYY